MQLTHPITVAPQQATACKHELVMLLDDSDLDNFINQKIIESARFSSKLKVSNSISAALEYVNKVDQKAPEHHQVPEVIFIDVNMPVMNGYELIKYLMANYALLLKNTKLVILTASPHEKERARTEGLPFDITYLCKPLTREMLDALAL
jgi:CheY-like chemotaxis protein